MSESQRVMDALNCELSRALSRLNHLESQLKGVKQAVEVARGQVQIAESMIAAVMDTP